MMKLRYMLLALCVVILFPALTIGQESVLRIPDYIASGGQFLNNQLAADTVANGGVIPANRVYVLTRGGLYLHNRVFQVRSGQTIRMRANDSVGVRPPVIMLYQTGLSPNPHFPPGNMIDLRGNLEFKNLIITGYFEAIDTNLRNLQGALLNVPVAGAGANVKIDSCILSNTNGNHIRTDGATNNFIITNSIFANMGYLGRSNLGAGKGFDLRDASSDTVIIQNNTFVNWQDRVLRHYNFANPQAGTGPINFLKFSHNTLVNGMSYHGLLSLGSMGPRAIITNNLLIDPFSLGNDSDATRQAEFVNNLEVDPYGAPRMTWIFTTPNDTTNWTARNNYYAISDSGQAFYDQFASAGVTGEGSPLTYHINARIGADSVNAFTKIPLTLANIPKLMTVMNRWYRSPTGGNKTKNTPGCGCWDHSFDFDRRGWNYWNDTLNCAYSTSSPAYTGAAGGYPAGDLNWFPTRYAAWLLDPINGVGGDFIVPEAFTLDQNYPNPFNPVTNISYSVPKQAWVTIEVFDVLGRKVATVVDEVKQAGTYTATFDGANASSGVYFYRLSAANQILTQKMILLK